jgi:hypothetical protein
MNLQMDRINEACETLKLNTLAVEWSAIADKTAAIPANFFVGLIGQISGIHSGIVFSECARPSTSLRSFFTWPCLPPEKPIRHT